MRTMKSFLLIHGGSHGAWCWAKLQEALRRRGARAFALDLPGQGNDTTPKASVNRQMYVAAAVNFIKQLPAEQFTLVGHSLAGVILPDVALACAPLIEEVVYLAGLVLDKGEEAMRYIPQDRHALYRKMAAERSDKSIMFPYERARELFFSEFSESEAKKLYQQLSAQPLSIYLDAVKVSYDDIPMARRYIICARDAVLTQEVCTEASRRLGGRTQILDASHDAMLSAPDELAEILLS